VGLYRSWELGGHSSETPVRSARRRLYQRIKRKKNHQKAVVAVARHLAEAAYWILKKQEVYRDPQPKPKVPVRSRGCNPSFVDARVSAEPAIALGG
jgi:hypothetical protein